MDSSFTAVGLILLALLVLGSAYARPPAAPPRRLPPGPPLPPNHAGGGHRSLLSGPRPWLKFREWHQQYGDLIYVQLGKQPVYICGSAQVAWDLLEKRSAIYSSRPRFIVAGEVLSNGKRGSLAPYGPFWRTWRKALHSGFYSKAAETYKPIQVFESTALMKDLMDGPADYVKHVDRYAASLIVTVVYGRRVLDVETDKVVKDNEQSMNFFFLANTPGRYAVESFPWLKHLPSFVSPWKREALAQRQRDIDLYTGLYNEVKERVRRGISPPCFARTMIETGADRLGMSELDLAYTCGTPFAAGVDTSAGSIVVFLLACAHSGSTFIPRAQEELDRVIGRDRLPTFEDLADLPYCSAVASESLRWRPIAVIGGQPHAVTQDDTYQGYLIPKGATVIASLWSIHLNETDFPDPDRFDPTRFLGKRDYPGPYGHSAFGFGRRICPGQYLGDNSVHLNVARLLWAFNLGPALDNAGRPVPVDISAFTDGFNSRPRPFQVSITPRSGHHRQVVEREFAEAYDGLKAYE